MPANKDGYRPMPRRHLNKIMYFNLERAHRKDLDDEEIEWEELIVVNTETLANVLGTLADDFDLAVKQCLQELDSIQNGNDPISKVDQEDSFAAADVPTTYVLTADVPVADVSAEDACNSPLNYTSDDDKVNVQHPIDVGLHADEEIRCPLAENEPVSTHGEEYPLLNRTE